MKDFNVGVRTSGSTPQGPGNGFPGWPPGEGRTTLFSSN